MTSITEVRDRVCQHTRCLGISEKEAARFASLVSKWIHYSGKEWTVDRLKSLKQAFHDSIQTGEHYIPPSGWAVRVNSKGRRILADNFLHRVLTQTRFSLKQVEGILRTYQVIKLDKPSERQIAKMKAAIESDPTYSNNVLESLCEAVETRGSSKLSVYLNKAESRSKTLPELLGSESKRSPIVDVDFKGRVTYLKSVSRDSALAADWIDLFSSNKTLNSLWNKYPEEISRRFVTSKYIQTSADICDETPLLGSVVILQSGGAKARWIANPLLPIQALGEPLKDKLLLLCSQYPEIKTLNQDKGHEVVVKWLSEGRNVFSFDATAFTDRFPVKFQLAVAKNLLEKGLITNFDYDSLEIVVNGKWFSTDQKSVIQWKVGQPLGYGPSFHLATLSHAVLLDMIDRKHHGSSTGCWQVVGDDVVISNELVANEYKEIMTDLGVEINLQKSMISAKYAEFLGKLITPLGVNPSMKVQLLKSSSAIVDACVFYGWNGFKFLNRNQKRQVTELFIPDHLGGKGWRIPGQSYSRYLEGLNLAKLQRKAVKDELENFYGKFVEPSSVQKSLNIRSSFYDRNNVGLSLSEWELLDTDVSSLNVFNNIPVMKDNSDLIPNKKSSIPQNTFVDTMDTIVRLNNLMNSSVVTKDGKIDRSNPATAILTDLGYLNSTEKEQLGSQSLNFNKEKNYDASQNKPPTRKFFNSEGLSDIARFGENSEDSSNSKGSKAQGGDGSESFKLRTAQEVAKRHLERKEEFAKEFNHSNETKRNRRGKIR